MADVVSTDTPSACANLRGRFFLELYPGGRRLTFFFFYFQLLRDFLVPENALECSVSLSRDQGNLLPKNLPEKRLPLLIRTPRPPIPEAID